jgi:signal transduction histidine kinase
MTPTPCTHTFYLASVASSAVHLWERVKQKKMEAQSVAPIVQLRLPDPSVRIVARQVRSELARELHDQVAQNLTGLLMQTQVFAREYEGRQDILDHLAFVHSSVRQVLNNVRQILCDLRGERGLADDLIPALREGLLPSFRRHGDMNVRLWVSSAWPATLPPDTCIHIYRIIQESVTNARKHGGATNVHVALKATAGRFVISIRDNGHGMSHLLGTAGPSPERIGMGILGMRERAGLLGGTLSVDSGPAGGTMVKLSIPKEALHWSSKRELPGS